MGDAVCIANRVGDRYLHQLELTGHAAVLDNPEHFAELGIAALRFSRVRSSCGPAPSSVSGTSTTS